MALSLDKIKPAKGSRKRVKRVGRGNSSGKGTYSGKGLKGQKSRSGVSNLKRIGMKKQILQIPKLRGFKSKRPKNQIVNIVDINKSFKDGDKINPKKLLELGLIKKENKPVKILGVGDLKLKDLKFEGVKFSKTVKEKLKKI